MREEYQSPEGFHRHQCEGCGFIWEHAEPVVFGTARVEDHRCPGCGKEEWFKYRGGSPPEATTQPERSVL